MENRSLGENLKLHHLVYNEDAWDQEKEEIITWSLGENHEFENVLVLCMFKT